MPKYPNRNILLAKKIENTLFEAPGESNEKDAAYYKRYGLSEAEYSKKWEPIKKSIFDPEATEFPETVMFRPEFKLFFTLPDEGIITSKMLTALKGCMLALNEKAFVVVPNWFLFMTAWLVDDEACKLKFPSLITYKQMLDGGEMALMKLTGNGDNDQHYIFGESGQWGLYSSNIDNRPAGTCDYSVYILGFREEVAPLFINTFQDFDNQKGKEYILKKCFPRMPLYKPYKKDFITMCNYKKAVKK